MKPIKKVVTQRLLELNWKIEDLAQKVGISKPAISQIFTKNSTSIETLEKMANVLGISISDFFNEPARIEEPPVGYRVIKNDDYIQLLEDAYGRTKKELTQKNA